MSSKPIVRIALLDRGSLGFTLGYRLRGGRTLAFLPYEEQAVRRLGAELSQIDRPACQAVLVEWTCPSPADPVLLRALSFDALWVASWTGAVDFLRALPLAPAAPIVVFCDTGGFDDDVAWRDRAERDVRGEIASWGPAREVHVVCGPAEAIRRYVLHEQPYPSLEHPKHAMTDEEYDAIEAARARVYERCDEVLDALVAALDAVPIPAPFPAGSYPLGEYMDAYDRLCACPFGDIFACASCGAPLTLPALPAPDWPDPPLVPFVYNRPFIEAGLWTARAAAPDWMRRELGDDADGALALVSLTDARRDGGGDGARSQGGCCGSYPMGGYNALCPNGHVVGSRWSECVFPNVLALALDKVVRRDAAVREATADGAPGRR